MAFKERRRGAGSGRAQEGPLTSCLEGRSGASGSDAELEASPQ